MREGRSKEGESQRNGEKCIRNTEKTEHATGKRNWPFTHIVRTDTYEILTGHECENHDFQYYKQQSL